MNKIKILSDIQQNFSIFSLCDLCVRSLCRVKPTKSCVAEVRFDIFVKLKNVQILKNGIQRVVNNFPDSANSAPSAVK